MKKILTLIAVICLTLSMTGCAKCISTEYESVEVKIVDEYHRGAYSIPVRVGKGTHIRRHPAVYRITVEYNGIEYTINGSDTYNKYKDKIGQTAIGTLKIRKYDNGIVKYDIQSLQ